MTEAVGAQYVTIHWGDELLPITSPRFPSSTAFPRSTPLLSRMSSEDDFNGAEASSFVTDPMRPKKRKLLRACDTCRRRKIKCIAPLLSSPWSSYNTVSNT
jgi:hypothetical protein